MSLQQMQDIGKNSGVQSLYMLQNQLRQLQKERQQVYKNIRQVQKSKRLFETDGHSQGRKIVKKDDLYDQYPQQTNKEEIKKAVELQSVIENRNRRVVGVLNQYLKKAQSRLNFEKEKEKDKRNIMAKIQTKEKDQIHRLQENKIKEIQNKLKQLNTRKQYLQQQIWKTQNAILSTYYSSYSEQLYGFMLTSSQPHLLWKPSKENPLLNKKAQLNTQRQKKRAAQMIEGINRYNEKFDPLTFIRQNEAQFNSNLIRRYFQERSHCLLTKNQPQICWMPNSHGANSQTIIKATENAQQWKELKQSLEDCMELKKIQKYQQNCQEHLQRFD